MSQSFDTDLQRSGLTRRDFLRLTSAFTATAVMAPLLDGCAVNPVTGQSQLMFHSKEDEIAMDQNASPHQFSNDYGPVQDAALNNYVDSLGKKMGRLSHRPDMPYNYRVLNATYVNAYAFPGGSIATTRGILLELEDEAELAALIGHENGHVNARHTSASRSKGLVLSAIMAGATAYATSQAGSGWQPLIAGLGTLSTSALLMHYSRENERQADDLGMEYATRAGLNPKGMVGLHELLMSLNKRKPTILETMFATHPMSSERHATAVKAVNGKYKPYTRLPSNRERFMDHTARLRRQKGVVKELQNGSDHMRKEDLMQAEQSYSRALNMQPNDYAGLLMMAECQAALDRPRKAEQYARRASQIYPQEPRAQLNMGVARLMGRRYNAAYENFVRYDRMLPGNIQMEFFKGYAMDAAGNKQQASSHYYSYLQQVRQGDQAVYAYQRLRTWGVVQ
ncbi:Putative Zn-dependent protease, contains TPR repeats [Paucidesulfovibrio gracilis DSM 16080]|uniref:Putative Zn-dependent protease, contains TPR repeats n=1 Tax=Paucidesulfovibrio gracilis DSM 16080 TaxID=1121449 RepID=A0A1T4X492_9BACT|nr:M48 family metalloprotease [Paucidesulfovibrio gracilis]SKA83671.1 Putative Zn-dependent protease, contains TPR repeats [Paucidesulfovibrio gracilis DSM 16080]